MKGDNDRNRRKASTKRHADSNTRVASAKRLQTSAKRKVRKATRPSAKAQVLRTTSAHRSRAHTSSAGRRRQARRDAK